MRTVTRRPRSDGRVERDEAVARVDRHAPEDWKQEARAVVSRLCHEQAELTTDDVWDRMTRRPPEPRALGAVMVWARNRGFIAATDEMRESERPEAHRNPKRVWKSLVYRLECDDPRDVPGAQHLASTPSELRRHEKKPRGGRAQSQEVETRPSRPALTAEQKEARQEELRRRAEDDLQRRLEAG